MEGWLRNVHAGQAVSFDDDKDDGEDGSWESAMLDADDEGIDVSGEALAGRDVDRVRDEDADNAEWEVDVEEERGEIGAGTDVRGTPQSPQTWDAAGLRPGGLRYAHTWHSHVGNADSDGPVEAAEGVRLR
jgi:hypothetical protein